MKQRKKFLTVLMVVLLFCVNIMIVSCKKQNNDDITKATDNENIETVKVESGTITPTLSTKTEIKKASNFVVQSNEKGVFKSNVAQNSIVKKGQVIGYVGNTEIKTPVDAVVVNVCDNVDVPKNYPLFELSYTGFSLDVKATDFLQTVTNCDNLKAKFQVQDGIGPEDILAVVLSSDDPSVLQCLISHDSSVRLGQFATVVITDVSKENVMMLPLSVVAGRLKNGTVTRIVDGKMENVKVELGVTDGAYIEILSGLNVSDEIYTLAPNLDPREQ